MKERIDRLVAKLGDLDAIIVSSNLNRFYLTSFENTAGTLLITKEETFYFADFRYIQAVKTKIPFVTAKLIDQNALADVAAIANERGVKKLGFEDLELTVNGYESLKSNFAHTELVPIGNLVVDLRMVKDAAEKELIQKAQEITDAAFTEILTKIKIGMTEKDVERELFISLYANGAYDMAFKPIVVSGPNSSLPHGKATDRKLQDGDFLTMDFGATYKGYCSDMTRTVAIGSATEEMKKVYAVVLNAQLQSLAAIKAGTVGNAIDKVGRDIITNAGYGHCFGHGLGHGFGLFVHENPRYSRVYQGVVPVDAVMTIEPGIYLEGKFGVRIEDDVFVTEDGCINITKSPKELIIIK